ncbi:AI-2E family transporter [Acetobacter oeni]|uniref:AI-2E family transporter n=1 Tax=Acetobacter oeni TaxID=304077 RepID=A0A511XHS6_9PROT|nr:AI-2E family transporter [Acetobacter oeni]MBB3882558.1 putative PurR-regulated permease PerM [Acetobacter oeni]NHO18631.1 AI-2E family transporter [Acetobacter oeni]GBR11949.1 transporter [Acetobacter oeni LMG 21952]GEN62505.1 AI-2E family transporter [Acetobacter oeni]
MTDDPHPADQDISSVPPEDPGQSIASLLRLTLLIAAVMLSIWLIGDVIMVVFAATLFAVILHGLARILHRRLLLPYGWSLALVCVILVAIIVGISWTSGSDIVAQASKLQNALVTQAIALRNQLAEWPQGRVLLDYLPASMGGNQGGSGQSGLMSLGSRIAGSMTGFLGSAFGALGTMAVVLIAGIYFAASPAIYANGILRLVPKKWRGKGREVMLVAAETLWAWVAGQALDMAVVGTLSGVGLWIIGVPLAFSLGFLAALCNFIPYIGAIMGAVPAMLLALSLGLRETAMVAALYCVVQFFEGNVLAPMIQRRSVQMPPGLTVLSQTFFGGIFGFPGLMLASPLTAMFLAVGDRLTPKLDDEERV